MPDNFAPATSSPNNSVKTAVQNIASGLFIFCVFVLTVVSILGVWDIFSSDVITKSFETLGLLAFVSVVVIVASRFVGDPVAAAEAPMPNPGFRATRNVTLTTLIVSSVLLAFLGVLAIWDVITSTDILHKSLSSLGIVAFSSFIVVIICLEREQIPFWKKHSKGISGGGVVVAIILIWLFSRFFF